MVTAARPVDRVRRVARTAGRARWVRKAHIVAGYGASWRDHLGYVLTSPELDTFSYRLANEAEVAAAVADVSGEAVAQVRAWFDELQSDHALVGEVRARVGWRPDALRTPRFGRQLARYALARAVRPELVVECGTKDGLGSLVLLRALERNRAQGGPDGHVLSIDIRPDAGWLVGPARQGSFELVVGRSTDVLPAALAGRRVGMLIHDSEPSLATATHELGVAVDHAAARLALLANGDWSPALRDLCAERGATCRSVREQPLAHFYPGARTDLAVLGSASH